jgi:hypothetical protein
VKSLAPTASATNAGEDPERRQDDNSNGLASNLEIGNSSSGGDKTGSP